MKQLTFSSSIDISITVSLFDVKVAERYFSRVLHSRVSNTVIQLQLSLARAKYNRTRVLVAIRFYSGTCVSHFEFEND